MTLKIIHIAYITYKYIGMSNHGFDSFKITASKNNDKNDERFHM